MNKDSALKLLLALGQKKHHITARDGWVLSRCPFGPTRHESGQSNSETFGVSVKPKGQSRFNCFACQSKGDLQDLIFDLKMDGLSQELPDYKLAVDLVDAEMDDTVLSIPDYEEMGPSKPEPDVVFPEGWLANYPHATKIPLAMKYLESRGVSKDTAIHLNLRFDLSRLRVCFPIRNRKARLVGFHGRDVTGNSYPYHAYRMHGRWSKYVWYGEAWVDAEKPVVIVESVFDLAAIFPAYTNVVCALSAGLSKFKIQRISYLQERLCLPDAGTGGKQFMDALIKYSPGIPHKVLDLPTGVKDPGGLDLKSVAKVLSPHVALDGPSMQK